MHEKKRALPPVGVPVGSLGAVHGILAGTKKNSGDITGETTHNMQAILEQLPANGDTVRVSISKRHMTASVPLYELISAWSPNLGIKSAD